MPVDYERIGTREICFTVYGMPAPQGSKRAFRNRHTGRIHTVESSKAVAPWRQDVKHAALAEIERNHPGWCPLNGPLAVRMTFRLPRPKGHYGTGRNAASLRERAPMFPTGRPDLSKLVRSTEDALTGIVWVDDSQLVCLDVAKRYTVEGNPMGCTIEVSSLPVDVATFTIVTNSG